MSQRTFQFRLHSSPSGSEPAAASLRLERQNDTGSWEPLIPALSTPGFRLYLSAMVVCLHYHLVAEARERGLPLRGVEGRFSACTAADWTLTQLHGDFQLQLERAEAPSPTDQGDPNDGVVLEAIRERMLHCPVLRNLDPAVPRTLHLSIDG